MVHKSIEKQRTNTSSISSVDGGLKNFPELNIPLLPECFHFKVVKALGTKSSQIVPPHYVVEIFREEQQGWRSTHATKRLLNLEGRFIKRYAPQDLTKENIEFAMTAAIQIMMKNYPGFKGLYEDLSKDQEDPSAAPLSPAEKAYLGFWTH